jgi:hypothetical protein
MVVPLASAGGKALWRRLDLRRGAEAGGSECGAGGENDGQAGGGVVNIARQPHWQYVARCLSTYGAQGLYGLQLQSSQHDCIQYTILVVGVDLRRPASLQSAMNADTRVRANQPSSEVSRQGARLSKEE